MKVALVTFNASSNGISLHVVPETDEEEELLRGLWRHGTLERCNGIGSRGAGFAVSWSLRRGDSRQPQRCEHCDREIGGGE